MSHRDAAGRAPPSPRGLERPLDASPRRTSGKPRGSFGSTPARRRGWAASQWPTEPARPVTEPVLGPDHGVRGSKEGPGPGAVLREVVTRSRALVGVFPVLLALLLSPLRAYAQWSDLGLSAREARQLRSSHGLLYACTNDGLYRKCSDSADSAWVLLAMCAEPAAPAGPSDRPLAPSAVAVHPARLLLTVPRLQ